jgi:hypothetical protein
MLAHASTQLGCAVGATSSDGMFTLEEAECLADCDHAPCVQVNHRYMRTTTASAFDEMIQSLRDGRLDAEVPTHGTLVRVKRGRALVAREQISAERSAAKAAREERTAQESK